MFDYYSISLWNVRVFSLLSSFACFACSFVFFLLRFLPPFLLIVDYYCHTTIVSILSLHFLIALLHRQLKPNRRRTMSSKPYRICFQFAYIVFVYWKKKTSWVCVLRGCFTDTIYLYIECSFCGKTNRHDCISHRKRYLSASYHFRCLFTQSWKTHIHTIWSPWAKRRKTFWKKMGRVTAW